ncbi:hypothetical protein HYW94_00410 [Candidatus Uhrbacteria bacterium]|nr:hypothetical protein [Candidatus Uhrbacteria bacterium]
MRKKIEEGDSFQDFEREIIENAVRATYATVKKSVSELLEANKEVAGLSPKGMEPYFDGVLEIASRTEFPMTKVQEKEVQRLLKQKLMADVEIDALREELKQNYINHLFYEFLEREGKALILNSKELFVSTLGDNGFAKKIAQDAWSTWVFSQELIDTVRQDFLSDLDPTNKSAMFDIIHSDQDLSMLAGNIIAHADIIKSHLSKQKTGLFQFLFVNALFRDKEFFHYPEPYGTHSSFEQNSSQFLAILSEKAKLLNDISTLFPFLRKDCKAFVEEVFNKVWADYYRSAMRRARIGSGVHADLERDTKKVKKLITLFKE